MISSREIKEKARGYGVPTSTVERDYAQNWLLKYLSHLNMVLKGGTGIRKTYIENYRFSDDLDFTLIEKLNLNELNDSVNTALDTARAESGVHFVDGVRATKNINGFEVPIYFRILRASGTPLKIKLDVTKHGKEKILLPIEERKILHPYSDNCKSTVRTYSLKEIIAEMIRSLFERTRPRDLFDLWYFRDIVKIREVTKLVYEKCELKDVKVDISSIKDRKYNFSAAWENSLRHQLKELPVFEDVFFGVIKQLEKLEG